MAEETKLTFSIRITTVGGVRNLLDVPKVVRAIQTAQNLYAGQIVNRGRHYPPERPNQEYVRTYELKRRWRVVPSRRVGDRMEVDILNEATDTKRRTPRQYAGYVFGFDDKGTGQSAYHVGRWPTKRQLANRESYRQQVQNAINRALGIV